MCRVQGVGHRGTGLRVCEAGLERESVTGVLGFREARVYNVQCGGKREERGERRDARVQRECGVLCIVTSSGCPGGATVRGSPNPKPAL